MIATPALAYRLSVGAPTAVAVPKPVTAPVPLPIRPPAKPRLNVDADAELHALVNRIAAGDQRALARFYTLSIGRVHGLALHITQQPALAEEVAEDVYAQIWRSASRYDPARGVPIAWALTICRSRAVDALRRRDKAVSDPDPASRVDAECPLAPDPLALLQATQEHAALHAAIARLSADQRQLLSLAFFRDMSHQDLVAHTGKPLGTVKSQLRRMLAALRQELGSR